MVLSHWLLTLNLVLVPEWTITTSILPLLVPTSSKLPLALTIAITLVRPELLNWKLSLIIGILPALSDLVANNATEVAGTCKLPSEVSLRLLALPVLIWDWSLPLLLILFHFLFSVTTQHRSVIGELDGSS